MHPSNLKNILGKRVNCDLHPRQRILYTYVASEKK